MFTSNIRHTGIGNNIVDLSDVVVASPVGAAPTTSSFSTPGFNGLAKGNCKIRGQSLKFSDFVRLILEILLYLSFVAPTISIDYPLTSTEGL